MTQHEAYRRGFEEYASHAQRAKQLVEENHPQQLNELYERVLRFLHDRTLKPILLVHPFRQGEGPVDFVGLRIGSAVNERDAIEVGIEKDQGWAVGQGHTGKMVLIGVDGHTSKNKSFHHQFIIHHGEPGFLFGDRFTIVYYSYGGGSEWQRIDGQFGIPRHDRYLDQVLTAAGVTRLVAGK